MVKLAFVSDRSASRRLLRHVPMTSSFDKVWRAMLSTLSLGKPIMTVCPQEKAGHMEWSIRFVPTYKVSTDNAETKAAIVMLSRRTHESASDVVVHDMVR